MGLFDAFRSKKKKQESVAESETIDLMSLDDVDLSGIEPCETRYTQEYQEFLAAQEAAAESGGAPEQE